MTIGFFKSENFKISNPASMGTGCGKCRLYKGCEHPKMEPWGEGRKGLMLIGEAPGETEDRRGVPFVGKSGQMINSVLRSLHINPDTDIVKLNAVSCRPPKNRTPDGKEIEQCRGRVWAAIEKHKPKVIITFGMVPIQSLVEHRWFDDADGLGGMMRWRGWAIPDRSLGCWVCPITHPAYVLRMGGIYDLVFEQDMERAVSLLEVPVPTFMNEQKNVRVFENPKDVIPTLEFLLETKPTLAFDYETSGLKPYNRAHDIWYVGVAYGRAHGICFPFGNKRVRKLWAQICADPDIPKIAHNVGFEDLWTREILGVQTQGWKMCTMLTSHVLDQRKSVTGLKFQTYVRMGLPDYSSTISPYLKATAQDKEKFGDNAINQIAQAPPKPMMLYCGMDCLSTYELAILQCKDLGADLQWVRI